MTGNKIQAQNQSGVDYDGTKKRKEKPFTVIRIKTDGFLISLL